jgi:CheY-like chemotaxis protein
MIISQQIGTGMAQEGVQLGVAYRVVVADGDRQLLTLAEDQLSALGHRVQGATRRAGGAMDLASIYGPDLLLLDLDMPDLDVDRLRALIMHMPTMAVLGTSYPGCPMLRPALAAGMHGHLPRPSKLADLAKAIADAVARLRTTG